jgi:hypothetical protein
MLSRASVEYGRTRLATSQATDTHASVHTFTMSGCVIQSQVEHLISHRPFVVPRSRAEIQELLLQLKEYYAELARVKRTHFVLRALLHKLGWGSSCFVSTVRHEAVNRSAG